MEYRALHIVSDLHLGGYTGVFDSEKKDWVPLKAGDKAPEDARSFRIFRDAEALAWAIKDAAQQPGPTALVLNGDIVDFLAMPDAAGFDPEGARAKLELIVNDPEQQPVWKALREFVASEKGDLVLVLGNHDVELLMHDASAYLINYLTGGVEERGKRILHCYNGKGFSCTVGGTNVLAVHGNSVDPWNDINYPLVAEYAEARRLKTRRPEIRPNAGSTLVVEHMNAVKRQYQWIDLLKPEQRGAALVSAALDKEHAAPISLLIENFFTRGGAMRRASLLGEQEGQPAREPQLRKTAAAAAGGKIVIDMDAVFRDALEKDAAGVPASHFIDPEDDGMLSALEVIPGLVKLKLGSSLREVLHGYLPKDRSFDFSAPDDTYLDLDKATDPWIDFLVSGHTHLERSLLRRNGPGFYFNSGTWIKLVSIPTDVLVRDEAFAPVESALKEGSMDVLERDIEAAGRTFKIIKSIRTVVRIEALQGGGARGALCHVVGQPGSFSLEEVKDSVRTKRR